jgi:hypothetical protein
VAVHEAGRDHLAVGLNDRGVGTDAGFGFRPDEGDAAPRYGYPPPFEQFPGVDIR